MLALLCATNLSQAANGEAQAIWDSFQRTIRGFKSYEVSFQAQPLTSLTSSGLRDSWGKFITDGKSFRIDSPESRTYWHQKVSTMFDQVTNKKTISNIRPESFFDSFMLAADLPNPQPQIRFYGFARSDLNLGDKTKSEEVCLRFGGVSVDVNNTVEFWFAKGSSLPKTIIASQYGLAPSYRYEYRLEWKEDVTLPPRFFEPKQIPTHELEELPNARFCVVVFDPLLKKGSSRFTWRCPVGAEPLTSFKRGGDVIHLSKPTDNWSMEAKGGSVVVGGLVYSHVVRFVPGYRYEMKFGGLRTASKPLLLATSKDDKHPYRIEPNRFIAIQPLTYFVIQGKKKKRIQVEPMRTITPFP